MSILKAVAEFETTLVNGITASSATAKLVSNVTKDTDGSTLPNGDYGFVIDERNGRREYVIATVNGFDLTFVKRGISFADGDTEKSSNKFSHRKGASIKITAFPILIRMLEQMGGTINLDGVPKNPSSRSISDPRHLVDKEYADTISSSTISSLAVTNAGGLNININSGYYILNGAITLYAGASGQALTDDTINYVELLNGSLSINTTGFSNDALPLAKITTASGAISVLQDTRAFYTSLDLRGQTSGKLVCGTASTSTPATWAAITNGSFKATIDGVVRNVNGINFTGNASMAEVATTIQTALRAVTGGTEVVTWVTDHFEISSGTTGSESQISTFALVDSGTVGTDISGQGSPTYMNGQVGSATQGTGNPITRDSSGLFIDLDTASGLKVKGGKFSVNGTVVRTTGDQSIGGVKTFTSIPELPVSNPTTDNQSSRKAYVDSKALKKIYIGTSDVTVQNTTTETNLVSVTIPGGTLSTSNGLKVRLNIGTYLRTSGTFVLRFKYGGTTLITTSSLSVANVGVGYIEFYLLAAGTTGSQKGFEVTKFFDVNTSTSTGHFTFDNADKGTSSVDSTTDQTLAITIQFSIADVANSITVSNAIITKID